MGRVRSLDRDVVRRDGSVIRRKGVNLRPAIGKDRGGAWNVTLCAGGSQRNECWSVASLVLLAFVGERPSGKEVEYIDRDKDNFALCNLRYRPWHGNSVNKASGEKQGRSRLKSEHIPQIFRLHHSGVTARAIANQFGVSEGTVFDVIHRRTWRYVDVPRELFVDPTILAPRHPVAPGQRGCSVRGCTERHHARGMCSRHLSRQMYITSGGEGDIDALMRKAMNDLNQSSIRSGRNLVSIRNIKNKRQGGRKPVAMLGLTFGRLRVDSPAGTGKYGPMWWCQCECGALVKKNGEKLRCGDVKSCGCLLREKNQERLASVTTTP
jgi:hypothetical protein